MLGKKHNVTSEIFQHLPPTDPAYDSALYIIAPAHSLRVLTPTYILYQTEQWGHHTLEPYNAVWANQRSNVTHQTTLEAFKVSIEYKATHTVAIATFVIWISF